MKNVLLCLLLVSIYSCKADNSKDKLALVKIDSKITNLDYFSNTSEELYTIDFDIKKLDTDFYDLIVHIKLKNGSYFVSPNSKGNFSGIFTLKLENNGNLLQIAKLKESPLSVEEYDPHPFVNGNVNWVRENTMYKQQLTLNTKNDFSVSGLIQFTIEPKCTLEKIPFVITYKNGEMKVEIDNC